MTEDLCWVESRWTAEELDGKHVAFRILKKDRERLIPISGTGRFRAVQGQGGLVRIEIVVTLPGATANEWMDEIFYCPQNAASLIEKQPPGGDTEFVCFQWQPRSQTPLLR